MEPTCADTIDPPANVLLVHASRCEPGACRRLRRDDLERPVAELEVSFENGTLDRSAAASDPDKLGLVSVGDVIRAASPDGEPDFAAPIAVDAVKDPNDLSAIGVSVSNFCEHWLHEGEQLVVCFHSLDALLRHTPPKKVFQFTHVLTNRLADVGALAHFHLDPSVHDDSVVATFGSIFDEIVADDSAQDRLPEASDEEVAQMLAEWEGDGGSADDGDAPRVTASAEATDEEIARLLEE